jgi:hypothetical protein
MYRWFTYQKWWFSMAMLVYQRVYFIINSTKCILITWHRHLGADFSWVLFFSSFAAFDSGWSWYRE